MIADNKPQPILKKIYDALSNYCPGNQGVLRDLYLVVFILMLQITVIRTSLLGDIILDFTTPLVAFLAIKSNIRRSLFFSMLAGILIETHSSSPFGLYLSSYWALSVVIAFVKPHISWRQISSWIYVFLASQAFVIIMTAITIFLRTSDLHFQLIFVGQVIFQLMFALILFQILPKKWLEGDFGEERSW